MRLEDQVRVNHMVEAAGDAARTLGEDIPWNAIAGMRNRVIHAYFDVDAELVWKTVTVELPVLTARLRKLQAA